jgi:transposase-like protein
MKWNTEFGHLKRTAIVSSSNQTGGIMTNKFSPEFKRECAQLVLLHNYTQPEAAKAMNVSISALKRWIYQIRDETNGKTPKASAITPEHIEIQALKKRLQRVEMENDILKKATALLMSDSLNNSR